MNIFSADWNPGHWTWMMRSNSASLGGERATCQLAAQVSLQHPCSIKFTVSSLFSRCHCYISQGWILLSMVIQWEWTINPLKTLEFQYICYTLFFLLSSPLGLSCHPLFRTPININLWTFNWYCKKIYLLPKFTVSPEIMMCSRREGVNRYF